MKQFHNLEGDRKETVVFTSLCFGGSKGIVLGSLQQVMEAFKSILHSSPIWLPHSEFHKLLTHTSHLPYLFHSSLSSAVNVSWVSVLSEGMKALPPVA